MDKETIIDILTIDSEIRKSFEEEEEKLEIYQEKVNKLKSLSNNTELSLKIRNDILYEVEILGKKIEDIQTSNSINFYIMEISPILNKYKEVLKKPLKISFFGKKTNDNSIFKEKDELITKFLEIASKYKDNLPLNIEKDDRKKKKSEISPHHLCENCDSKSGLELLDGKTYICHQCGFEKEILGIMSSFKDTTRVNLSNKYTYERRIHFRDCMNQYQGKQNSSIDHQVFDDLEHQFELHGLLIGNKNLSKEERFKNISKDHILLFLKETGHTKHYEDVFLIFYKMTGKKPDDISHLENKLIDDFETLSNLYDKKFKHDKNKKIERKSFINIQYVLYQLLRKYKHPCKKEDFNILKTLDRKSFHDDIMKELFEELNWNFFCPQF
jgi:hypothetical protein